MLKSKTFWMSLLIIVILAFIIGFFRGINSLKCSPCPSSAYITTGLSGGAVSLLFVLIPAIIISFVVYFISKKIKS